MNIKYINLLVSLVCKLASDRSLFRPYLSHYCILILMVDEFHNTCAYCNVEIYLFVYRVYKNKEKYRKNKIKIYMKKGESGYLEIFCFFVFFGGRGERYPYMKSVNYMLTLFYSLLYKINAHLGHYTTLHNTAGDVVVMPVRMNLNNLSYFKVFCRCSKLRK